MSACAGVRQTGSGSSRKQMRKSEVRLADVAKAAGVSVMTASRALDEKGVASLETRARVQAAATKLGYRPNKLARLMRSAHSNIVCIVVNDLSSQLENAFVKAISTEVRHAAMEPFICNAGGTLDLANKSLPPHEILQGLCDGFLYVLPRITDEYRLFLEQSDTPSVLINSGAQASTLPTIRCDKSIAIGQAIRYLADLGHSRIAYIRDARDTGQSDAGEQGYLQGMQSAGLPIKPEWIANGDSGFDSGWRIAEEVLSLPSPPSAIIAATHRMAWACLMASRNAGLQSPRDISIIGVDELPSDFQEERKLSTLRQPIAAMAKAAVKELSLRSSPSLPQIRQALFPSELLIRGSTGPAPQREPR